MTAKLYAQPSLIYRFFQHGFSRCVSILPAVIALQTIEGRGSTINVSDLDLKLGIQDYAPPSANKSGGNAPIVMAGREMSSGCGTRGYSRLDIDLDGAALSFDAQVGMTDDSEDQGPVWFEIITDGKLVLETEPFMKGQTPRTVNANLMGVHHLALVVQSPDQPRPFAAWGNARISYSKLPPHTAALLNEEQYILTPKETLLPRLTGASVVGAGAGHPFLFRIPATGAAPLSYGVGNLPASLSLDPATGIITGTAPGAGSYDLRIVAQNAFGRTSRNLRLVVGGSLALTPPMGWNSWNCFASAVTAADVRAAGDAILSLGLVEHGWTYVNIDDFWETRPVEGDPIVEQLNRKYLANGNTKGYHIRANDDPLLVGSPRDSKGRINSNKRFPNMPELAAYLHGLGLKAGLYSSPGPLTCGQCTGSFGHADDDAARFAEWGFDFLKYDMCTYSAYLADHGLAEGMKPYKIMGAALHSQPRDIVFSMCQYGRNDVWMWGKSVYGNSWRTTGDINDSWGSMAGIGFSQNGHEQFAGPGHWNDIDMLVVGSVGWGRSLHKTHLSPNEQYTHISLWSLLASPLLIGCDLTKVDGFTLGLLTNDEVIAIDQDPLGKPAHRVSRSGDVEVWARPLADGSIAVGFFNRGELEADISALWGDLNISGAQEVRDLWRQVNLGVYSGSFSGKVLRHGVLLLKLSPKSEVHVAAFAG